jgi:hypothetical protein
MCKGNVKQALVRMYLGLALDLVPRILLNLNFEYNVLAKAGHDFGRRFSSNFNQLNLSILLQ